MNVMLIISLEGDFNLDKYVFIADILGNFKLWTYVFVKPDTRKKALKGKPLHWQCERSKCLFMWVCLHLKKSCIYAPVLLELHSQ